MNPQGHQTGRGGHEGKDADVINLAMIASLLLLVIIMCLLVCWGILHAFNREQTSKELPRVRMVEQAARFPQPQLLTEPGKEWRQTRLAAETRLRTYGWVDREAGVAHIPITAAMKLKRKTIQTFYQSDIDQMYGKVPKNCNNNYLK